MERDADAGEANAEEDVLTREEAELAALIAEIGPLTSAVPPLRDDAVALAYEERERAQL